MNKTTGFDGKSLRNNLMIEVPLEASLNATTILNRNTRLSIQGGLSVGRQSGRDSAEQEDPSLATFLRLKMGMPLKHNNMGAT
jgi:hypothetical protein